MKIETSIQVASRLFSFLETKTLKIPNLLEIHGLLKENSKILLKSVENSPIYWGECPRGKELCVKDELPFHPIYIDWNNISENRNGMVLSELISILIHEYSHQFLGEMDHPDHELTQWAKNKFEAQDYKTQTFSIFSPQYSPTIEVSGKKYFVAASKTSFNAKLFCNKKGYIGMKNVVRKYFNADKIESTRIFERATVIAGASSKAFAKPEILDGHYMGDFIKKAKERRVRYYSTIVCSQEFEM